MTLPTRLLLLLSALAILPLAAIACAGGDDDGPASPIASTATTGPSSTPQKPSGSITVYSGRSESLVKKVINDFEAQTGVDVNVKYAGTTELAALLMEEGSKSPADVYFAQDAGALGAVAQAGLLSALPENTTKGVPAPYRATDNTWVGVSGRARVVVYNPDLVSADRLPKSYKDLTQAAWQGKIGWAPTNASFQTFVTAVREVDGQAAAEAWLEAMKANGTQEYKDNPAILNAVAAGEISMGIINHYYLYAGLRTNPGLKAQNHYLAPNDAGSLVNVAGVAILKTSKNKVAAQAFVSFLLSEQAQRYFSEQTYEYPVVAGIPADSRLRPLAQLDPPDIDLSNLKDLQGTVALLRSTAILP